MTKEDRIVFLTNEIDVLYQQIETLDKETLDVAESFDEYMDRRNPYYVKINKLDGEKRMLMEPEFQPISTYGDVMKLKDFIEDCKCGAFVDYDGHGYYVRDNMESNIKIHPSDVKNRKIRKDFDTIIWFNR